jgi:C4-dicarboxylate-specific signal transduction histidine kinase
MEQHERIHREEIAHFARLSTIGEMSSALAHELNQPLCAIATYAEGALRMMKSGDWDSNELLEAIQEAGTQAERAGKIIRRIANLVRKKEPHRSSVNIGEIISETINLIEYEARLKGITIKWVEPSENSPMLKVDRIQIQQVLVNLLHNSFEAMKNVGQSKCQISIEVSTDGKDMVQVVVSDTGCGLSAERADRIFEPFFTTNSQGLGMGLSISRSIIEAHGGRIWAESNPAGGATFRFTLPI